MKFPYVVGRWVRGPQHYGRQRLINYLLNVPNTAVWLVGTRRMGKTSLLRQIEMEAELDQGELVPLFWDLQGCDTPEALSDELSFAIEDVMHRFEPYGVTAEDIDPRDAVITLRRITRRLAQHERRLLLLIDEGEALIRTAEINSTWLARLRKVFQDERQRTILASTKLLTRLNELTADWITSPFLFGFNMANLWSLDEEAAYDLIRQSQEETQVDVPQPLCEQILHASNRHPYLIQYLCQRLFTSEEGGVGALRPIEASDLIPDHLLVGFLQIDFQHLSLPERRILLAVAQASVLSDDELYGLLPDIEPARVNTLLYGMHKLGYLRAIDNYWAVGNEFLRYWLQQNLDELRTWRTSEVASAKMEEVLTRGATMERASLLQEIGQLQSNLIELERRQHLLNGFAPPELSQKIDFARRALSTAQQEVAALDDFHNKTTPSSSS
ncbi:MAG: hypothetical protein KDD92_09715 [Caldilineaceae bacterium]|nr:hypothetical protein [Caldilineaceae bacterium]